MAKAHIIPRSLYGWKSAKGWDTEAVFISSDRSQHAKRSRTGIYDKEILCIACEEKLSHLDDRAARTLLHEVPQSVIEDSGETLLVQMPQSKSKELLMFFIFLLWRMSESNHQAFNEVALGSHKEVLAKAILSLNPSICPQIDVCVQKFDKQNTGILSPTKFRLLGINGYRTVLSGYTAWIKIDQRSFPDPFCDYSLRATDKPHFLVMPFAESAERKAMIKLVKGHPAFEKLDWGSWKDRKK